MAETKVRDRLKFPTVTVETAGGELEVRNLTPEALDFLIEKHSATLQKVFFELPNNPEELELSLAGIQFSVLKYIPQMMAEIIALGCQEFEEETIEFFRKNMGISDQQKCVEEIFKLTFKSDDEVKKLIEAVVTALSSSMTSLSKLTANQSSLSPSQASVNGSSRSGKASAS